MRSVEQTKSLWIEAPYMWVGGRWISNGVLKIQGNRILECRPKKADDKPPHDFQSLFLKNHAVMPGLINAHAHLGMGFLRAYGSDLPLMQWLHDHIFPFEKKNVSPEFVEKSMTLSLLECFQSGITSVVEMYFFAEKMIPVVEKLGMRAQLCRTLSIYKTPENSDVFQRMEEFNTPFDPSRLVQRILGPHANYSVSDEILNGIRKIQERCPTRVHMHVQEASHERNESIEKYGRSPIQRFKDAGIFNSNLFIAHGVHLNEEDQTNCVKAGVSVVHCPDSNSLIASGIAPIAELVKRGGVVALGTDGPATNHQHNIWGAMNLGSKLQRLKYNDPAVLPSHHWIDAATRGGAYAMGLKDQVGELKSGALADWIAVDLKAINLQPVHDLSALLVHACLPENVSHVVVDGVFKKKDHQLVPELQAIANEVLEEIPSLASKWRTQE